VNKSFSLDPLQRDNGDTWLLSITILMVGLGLSVLFSASYFTAERLHGNAYFFFSRQLVWAGLGFVGAFVLSRIPLVWVRRAIPILLIVAFVLMVFTLLFSRPLMGARRWLVIGRFTFQPSELVKTVMVLYLAHLYDKQQGSIVLPSKALVPIVVVGLMFIGLILLQNDYSTAIFLLALLLALVFIGGLRVRYFFLAALPIVPAGIIFLLSQPYRVQRIMTFLNPFFDPTGAGYQVLAARRALSEGGLWGAGLGAGLRKLGGLPEVQADFIFAVWAEEAGFLGVLVVFGLFALLAWQGYRLAWRLEEPFKAFLAFGLTTAILFQFLVNTGVVSGAFPATGIPLPFFSAGGSAMLMGLLQCGLLWNLARHLPGQKGGGL